MFVVRPSRRVLCPSSRTIPGCQSPILSATVGLLLWRRRPALAMQLGFGLCLALAGVVTYSAGLLLRPDSSSLPSVPVLAARQADLNRRIEAVRQINQTRATICADL